MPGTTIAKTQDKFLDGRGVRHESFPQRDFALREPPDQLRYFLAQTAAASDDIDPQELLKMPDEPSGRMGVVGS